MEERAYLSQVIYKIEETGPSGCQVEFERYCGALVGGGVTGTVAGLPFGVLGALPGGLVGALIGWGLACRWSTRHARLLKALKALPEEEKGRLVGLVQGVVGGSRDISDLEKFIDNGGNDKLLKALMENLNIRTI